MAVTMESGARVGAAVDDSAESASLRFPVVLVGGSISQRSVVRARSWREKFRLSLAEESRVRASCTVPRLQVRALVSNNEDLP